MARSLYLVLHCRDCAQPAAVSVPLPVPQPKPRGPVCRVCGGGWWHIVLTRVLPVPAGQAAPLARAAEVAR
jgi:hypothetical protein